MAPLYGYAPWGERLRSGCVAAASFGAAQAGREHDAPCEHELGGDGTRSRGGGSHDRRGLRGLLALWWVGFDTHLRIYQSWAIRLHERRLKMSKTGQLLSSEFKYVSIRLAHSSEDSEFGIRAHLRKAISVRVLLTSQNRSS